MADVNVFTFTGRVVRDAELIQKGNGVVMCDFAVANNYNKKSGDTWTKGANFFDVVLFGQRALSLYPYLKQGVLVGVDSEIRQHRWEQDGKKRVSNEIIINNVHLLSAARKEESSAGDFEEQSCADCDVLHEADDPGIF